MKKHRKIAVAVACILAACLWFDPLSTVAANQSVASMTDDEILLSTGMPQEEVNALDDDMKAYIVNDLKESGEIYDDLTYVSAEMNQVPAPRVEDLLSGIEFEAVAFKSNNNVTIYPTYEFTTAKKPAGADCFGFVLGNAFESYEYGGKLWYKDSGMTKWEVGGDLAANHQSLEGAAFSGVQLGSPDWSMKFKGCAYARAKLTSGTDKRIVMSYMYNPQRYSYSVSLSFYAGVSFNCPDRIYTAASTTYLKY